MFLMNPAMKGAASGGMDSMGAQPTMPAAQVPGAEPQDKQMDPQRQALMLSILQRMGQTQPIQRRSFGGGNY